MVTHLAFAWRKDIERRWKNADVSVASEPAAENASRSTFASGWGFALLARLDLVPARLDSPLRPDAL